jgi:hypothetical protein
MEGLRVPVILAESEILNFLKQGAAQAENLRCVTTEQPENFPHLQLDNCCIFGIFKRLVDFFLETISE